MTKEYARLSLLAGWTAGVIDGYLGSRRFRAYMRSIGWQLTEETLEALRTWAIAAGIPESELDPSTDEHFYNILKQFD